MISKRIATGCVAASLALGPVAPVRADTGDAILGGIIGGVIGGVVVNESNKNRARQQTTTRTVTAVPSATRVANQEVQVALNHFGFPVGSPDGVLGRQSRAAISQYQMTLGYPATGYLTEFERSHLVGSYHRAVAGGGLTMQQAAANPMGMRGLLVTWRDEAMGIAPQVPYAQPQGQLALAPAAPVLPVAPVETAAPATVVVPAPVEAAAPAAAAVSASGGLPTFLGTPGAQVSLASQCNKIGLMTTTNGGYTTVATMTNPAEALGEQFCLVRSYAIARGEELAAQVPGTTPQQITEQCAGLGPAMKDQIAALSLKPATEVVNDVRGFALASGQPPAQLAGTARICLSSGYASDNMDVALASGLILAALGEGAYAELMGHHLSQGFGAARRPDLAIDWYDLALAANAQPGAAVFAPGQPERMEVLRKAAYAVAGRADEAAAGAPVPAALPSLVVPGTAAPAGN